MPKALTSTIARDVCVFRDKHPLKTVIEGGDDGQVNGRVAAVDIVEKVFRCDWIRR